MTAGPGDDGALGRLLTVVGLLNSDLDLPLVLCRIADAGKDLLDATAAGVVGVRDGRLELRAVTGTDVASNAEQTTYEGSALQALDHGGADTLVADTSSFPAIHRIVSEQGFAVSTFAATRIVVHGETRGALYVFFAEQQRTLTLVERRMLELLAGHAGAAVSNAEAYEAVVAQRRHERAVIDAMADGLAVIDAEGIVRSWNPAAVGLTGLPAEQVLGRPSLFPHAAAGVTSERRLANGRWVEVLCSALPGPLPAETVVTFRDISAAKLVDEAKNLFLATSGHELRTPLTVIRGFADTLVSRWADLSDAERREAAAIIAARAAALGVLVDQILASSQAEVGARRLELQPLAVGPILAAAAVDAGSLSDRHQVTVDLPADLPLVLADGQALRTVLGHLVENAVKYSPPGSLIELSAGLDADTDDLETVFLRVDDQGIGVSNEDQERVFERFFQADGGDTRAQGGFGLGLYIVRRLVQAHDGSVTMARRPDGRPGSRVEVRLSVVHEI